MWFKFIEFLKLVFLKVGIFSCVLVGGFIYWFIDWNKVWLVGYWFIVSLFLYKGKVKNYFEGVNIVEMRFIDNEFRGLLVWFYSLERFFVLRIDFVKGEREYVSEGVR